MRQRASGLRLAPPTARKGTPRVSPRDAGPAHEGRLRVRGPGFRPTTPNSRKPPASIRVGAHIGSSGNKPLPSLAGALGLAAVGLAAYLVFRAFGVNYLRWYLAGGALIQFAIAGFAIAVDLERYPWLISTNPNEFLAEAWTVAGESYLAFADELERSGARSTRDDVPGPGPFDVLFAAFFYFAYFATVCAWTLVIAPLQYVGNLIAGAPVRLALASPVRLIVRRGGKMTRIDRTNADAPPQEGAEVIGLAQKPVATTAFISAGLLYALATFLSGD